MPTWVRLARTVALAVIIGIGLVNLIQAATHWTLSDAAAYWNAGMRLREGEPLYPLLTNVDASEVYRYAPWLAWLAVPVTYLPVQLAGALWSAVLLAASVVALVPLARARAWLAVAFFGPILVGISAVGNVADVRTVRSRGTPSGVIFAEVTVGVDGRTSVTDAHAIADEVERRITAELGDAEVTVHVEPA